MGILKGQPVNGISGDTDINATLQQWQEKFDQCLAIEFSNPAYFAVHHLLVLSYMIQTDAYSRESFPPAVRLLEDMIDSMSPGQFHARCRLFPKPITNRGDHTIHRYPWRKDIMSVKTDSAQRYGEDVLAWAADILDVIHNTTIPDRDP